MAVRRQGAERYVAFAVVVDRRSRATARLLKQRATIVSRGIALAKGRNARRLRVPGTATAGVYRLSVRIVAGGEVHTVATRVRIPR